MTELVLQQLEKAKAPWWVYVLAFVAVLLLAIRKASTAPTILQAKVEEYKRDKAAVAASSAQEDAVKAQHYARIEESETRIGELKKELAEVDAHVEAAKARIAAAKSLRDLQR